MLSQAQIEELTATVRRAVFSVCRRWDEDLAQDVWLMILPLVDKYDPQLGASLGEFVRPRCRGAAIDSLRVRTGFRNRHQVERVSLSVRRPVDNHDPVGRRREAGRTWQWEIDRAVAVEIGTEVEDRDELVRAMRRMPERGRAALVAQFSGEEHKTIAARLGVSESRVSQIISEACRAAGRR